MLVARGLDSGLRVSGRRWVGPCPIHGGDNPTAFVVDTAKNVWHCFTRCRGGDSLKLAYLLCGQSWPRVARWLTQLAGASLLVASLASARQLPKAAGRSPPARPFRPFRWALTLDPTHPFFRRMQLAPSILRAFEAGAWHGRGFLEGTVAVRLHDLDGLPVGYAGRRLNADEVAQWGKWKFPPGYPKGQLLYGWHRTRSYLRHGLIVVEGAWSVMKLWQAGLPNAVALGGTMLTAQQHHLLRQASRLVLFLDGDTAGRAASKRLAALHPDLCVVDCPAVQDPADLEEPELRRVILARVPEWSQLFPEPTRLGTASTVQHPLQARIAHH